MIPRIHEYPLYCLSLFVIWAPPRVPDNNNDEDNQDEDEDDEEEDEDEEREPPVVREPDEGE